MARLIVRSEALAPQVLELKLGANRLGRAPACDFPLDHVTVSALHCEIILDAEGVWVRDCESTNGTFIDTKRIKEARLEAGQILRLGDIELLVETTDATVAIPKIEKPLPPAPPKVLANGTLVCPRHSDALVTYQCTHCREVMCSACVHRLKRRGGKLLLLCPVCSFPCEPMGGEKKKRRGFMGLLQRTMKLPFLRRSTSERVDK